jgi:uncharacterized glyoxalase superfamily metalloenzyme YdcJ
MSADRFVSPDDIRSLFAQAMSTMYRTEVPLYGTLVDLVAEINDAVLTADPALAAQLDRNDETGRLAQERHGAIRVGTAEELATLGRLFAVMGMYPIGYYDLSVAGVPVHSTAFRPRTAPALAANPFRVFTSLLRLELIDDEALREESARILARRRIFTDEALALIAQAERDGGLDETDARRFVLATLETFRWHSDATVSLATYHALHNAHRLVADVVSFRGPHINHLTPRTLDIDAAQAAMLARGIDAKAVVEGPPPRRCPILLRQTSFKALQETVNFPTDDGGDAGTHTARFGEIEQRGLALTPEGPCAVRPAAKPGARRRRRWQHRAGLPDPPGGGVRAVPGRPRHPAPRRPGLLPLRTHRRGPRQPAAVGDLPAEALVAAGLASADPIVYEDFLPVSAAGIFQSNLGGEEQRAYAAHANRDAFEQALGMKVEDEFAIYQRLQQESLDSLRG